MLALPLGLVGMYARRRVKETDQFLAVSRAGHMISQPIPALWHSRRLSVVRGFTLIAADSLAFNIFIFMLNHI